ncbi:hypothetical protein KC19_6G197500 [Ceratodon purpureus]|uniref:Uncharacterized protein n=1 Tax=Ceratodon purpureus TaxID=3225 RepID=A0A8T0HJG0_CERPU|nr:hypothetical protein KC19_6G197500 [Ceratodon purpureus]
MNYCGERREGGRGRHSLLWCSGIWQAASGRVAERGSVVSHLDLRISWWIGDGMEGGRCIFVRSSL